MATDDFNRAGPGLGANWATLNTGWGDVVINSSVKITGSYGTSNAAEVQAARYTAGSFTDAQSSTITISGLAFAGGNDSIGVGVRVGSGTGTSQTGYYVRVRDDAVSGGSHTVNFYRLDSGGAPTPLHAAGVTFANGDTIGISAVGATITVLKNGVAIGGSFTQTDSTHATGLPAICATGNASVFGDDWVGADIGGGSSAKPAHYYAMMRAQ